MYKPKEVKQDAPLDLSRPNTGDSLKENIKEPAAPPPTMPGMLGGFPGFPHPLLLNLASTGSFDNSMMMTQYLLAYQQQEALRRQREERRGCTREKENYQRKCQLKKFW